MLRRCFPKGFLGSLWLPLVLRKDYQELLAAYEDLQEYAATVSKQGDRLIQRLVSMEAEAAQMGERFERLEKIIANMEHREKLLTGTIARMAKEAVAAQQQLTGAPHTHGPIT